MKWTPLGVQFSWKTMMQVPHLWQNLLLFHVACLYKGGLVYEDPPPRCLQLSASNSKVYSLSIIK